MDPDAQRFLNLLIDTTARVGGTFFSLPIVGQDLPVLRERVYGCEVYHQLRSVGQEIGDSLCTVKLTSEDIRSFGACQ